MRRAATRDYVLAGLFGLLAGSALHVMVPGGFGDAAGGVLAGTVVGLALRGRRSMTTAAVGALVGALGAIAIPLSSGLEYDYWNAFSLPGTAAALVLGALSAWLASCVAEERSGTIAWVALALSIALMAPAAVTRVQTATVHETPLLTWLRTPPTNTRPLDSDLYARLAYRVRTGDDYYSAAMQELKNRGQNDLGVLNVRLPTVYWLWSELPPVRDGRGLIAGLLVLGAGASAAGFVGGRRLAGSNAFALASAACIASTFTVLATCDLVTYTEPWAAALVVMSLACWLPARKEGPDTSPQWAIAAAGLALAAALIRETAVLVLAGGFVAAAISDRRDGGKRTWAWGGMLVLWGFAYAAHVWQVGGMLFGDGSGGVNAWMSPGLDRLVNVLGVGDDYVPFRTVGASVLLAALTVAGLLRRPLTPQKLFGLLGIAAPLALFCLLGPTDIFSGTALGYWGLLLKPAMWALAPAVALVGWPKRTGRMAEEPLPVSDEAEAAQLPTAP